MVRQTRSLPSQQRDMPAVFPILKPVHHRGQAGGGLGEIGCVDLGDVAQAYDLGAGTGAGDEGRELFGGQVLRLVDGDIAI